MARSSVAAAFADVPELGIAFSRFHAPGHERFIAWWGNATDANQAHIYEVRADRKETGGAPNPQGDPPQGWAAEALVDGRVVFRLEAASKCVCVECALAAMRRRLVSHRAGWRSARAAAAGGEGRCGPRATNAEPPRRETEVVSEAETRPEPLSPAEELAETVRRMADGE